MEHQAGPDLSLVVAVVAGLFSLLGAMLGAWLGRRSEYEKWLREGKSEVFVKFLELISKAQNDAINVLHDPSLSAQPRDIRVTEVYVPALDYARVVRLYLKPAKRDSFSKLAREVYALHSTISLGSSRLGKMGEALDHMQQMFEDELHG